VASLNDFTRCSKRFRLLVIWYFQHGPQIRHPVGKRPHLHPPQQTADKPALPPPRQSVPSPPIPVLIRTPLQPRFPAFIPRFFATAFVRTGFPQVNGRLYWYAPRCPRLDEKRELMECVDLVFAHDVNTVKKIPRAAGSSRPPLADRLLVIYPTPPTLRSTEKLTCTVVWIV
jgi:hypothetical protein